jgi:hypothetical protein
MPHSPKIARCQLLIRGTMSGRQVTQVRVRVRVRDRFSSVVAARKRNDDRHMESTGFNRLPVSQSPAKQR